MLGQFSRKDKADSSLHLSAGDGGSLVVMRQTGSLGCNSLEYIIDKAVHDAHGLAGNPSVRVDLLQHLVDVDAIAFLPLPLLFLVSSSSGLRLSCFLGTFAANFRRHDDYSSLMQPRERIAKFIINSMQMRRLQSITVDKARVAVYSNSKTSVN